MCPQLVDFNADGIQDMVMGTFEGVAFLLPGTATGYGEPERILDGGGNTILLSAFWNFDEEKWDDAKRSPEGERHEQDHCISVVAVDWDADGDLDLLLGAKEGRLYLRRNLGSASAPSFATTNELVLMGEEDFEVPGGLTAPRVVDWDSDGLFDLVCASFKGGVYLFLNVGQAGAPAFEEPQTLIGEGTPRNGDLPSEPSRPDRGTYVDVVDYDRDGDLDLLVGGYGRFQPEASALTDEQMVELAGWRGALKEVEADIFRRLDGDDEGAQAAFKRLINERSRLTALIQDLEPQPTEAGRVWLYRRL
jgi:hypothetical protein